MTCTNMVSETMAATSDWNAETASTALSFQSVDGELVIKRLFDAPPELVFKAWTDPELVAQWFGPCEVRMSIRELDVRPGGALRMEGSCGAGASVRIEGEYREVEEPDWLVYADACFVGDTLICETLATVTFHEQDDKTRLTIHCEPVLGFDAFAQRRWIEGWRESLERLAVQLNKLARTRDMETDFESSPTMTEDI